MIKPLFDKVIIKLDPAEEKVGSVFVVGGLEKRYKTGIVKASGGLCYNDNGKEFPSEVNVGDRVFMGEFAGFDIVIDGETFLMCRESEIIAKITEEV